MTYSPLSPAALALLTLLFDVTHVWVVDAVSRLSQPWGCGPYYKYSVTAQHVI